MPCASLGTTWLEEERVLEARDGSCVEVIQSLINGHQSRLDSLLLTARKPLFTAQNVLINVIHQFWIVFKLGTCLKFISYMRRRTWKNFPESSVRLLYGVLHRPQASAVWCQDGCLHHNSTSGFALLCPHVGGVDGGGQKYS